MVSQSELNFKASVDGCTPGTKSGTVEVFEPPKNWEGQGKFVKKSACVPDYSYQPKNERITENPDKTCKDSQPYKDALQEAPKVQKDLTAQTNKYEALIRHIGTIEVERTNLKNTFTRV